MGLCNCLLTVVSLGSLGGAIYGGTQIENKTDLGVPLLAVCSVILVITCGWLGGNCLDSCYNTRGTVTQTVTQQEWVAMPRRDFENVVNNQRVNDVEWQNPQPTLPIWGVAQNDLNNFNSIPNLLDNNLINDLNSARNELTNLLNSVSEGLNEECRLALNGLQIYQAGLTRARFINSLVTTTTFWNQLEQQKRILLARNESWGNWTWRMWKGEYLNQSQIDAICQKQDEITRLEIRLGL